MSKNCLASNLFAPLFLFAAACSTVPNSALTIFPLESVDGLDARDVLIDPVTHRGKKAIQVVETIIGASDAIVVLPYNNFRSGKIDVELAGQVRADAPPNMRGFVGIAFRFRDGDVLRYECFYLRPTNGRADDQLRRNHTTQYVSHPEFTWRRLRTDHPGAYESYVDLVPGEWTSISIVVEGRRAELYVNGSNQPTLIVRDLMGEVDKGGIALWIGDGTEAHFRNLRISSKSATK